MAKKQEEIIKEIETQITEQKLSAGLSSKRSTFVNNKNSIVKRSVNNKVRLSGRPWCQECENTVVVNEWQPGTPLAPNYKLVDPFNGQDINISHPQFTHGSVAKYGNKFWIKSFGSGFGGDIREFEINTNCGIDYIRTINFPALGSTPQYVDWGSGLCAMDANTLLIGSVSGNIPGGGYQVHKLDITGSAAVSTYLLQTPYTGQLGDVVYIPSNDTIVVLYRTQNPWKLWLRHYDINGAVLNTTNISTNIFQASLFSFGDDVYVAPTGWGGVKKYDLTNYTLTNVNFPGYNQMLSNRADAGSSPECPLSLCYDIGDIGPEGGIIFSVPGTGQNTSTNTYYEVAQSDIITGGVPSGHFNITCGDVSYVPSNYLTDALAIPADDNMFIDTSLPTNASFLNDLNSGVIGVGTFVNTDLTPNNPALMFPSTPPIPGEPIISISQVGHYVELRFNNPVINSFVPPLITHIFFYQMTSAGAEINGAEFGAHNIPPPAIQTSFNFGLGAVNTNTIDLFPSIPGTPANGVHPWLNTHDIAATLCKNHGNTNDWFSPSAQEFHEMFINVGPGSSATNQVVFNYSPPTATLMNTHLYWTSSQYIKASVAISSTGATTSPGLQDPDKYAYAYDVVAGTTVLAWRCHTLAVRPIRSFECGSTSSLSSLTTLIEQQETVTPLSEPETIITSEEPERIYTPPSPSSGGGSEGY